MAVKFSNNAVTTLTDSPSAGATSFNVASASAFPTLASGDWTYVSLTSEVVKVTAISGTTFTCDATSNAHASGESVELRMTAELLNDFAEDTESLPIGGGTMTGDVSLGTNVKAKFGADNDLQIYSDGMSSHIVESGTGNLNIKGDDLAFTNSAANKTYLNVDAASGSVYIRHGGSTKLVTTATGVDVTGSVTCDGLTVDGNATLTGENRTLNIQGGSGYGRLEVGGDLGGYVDLKAPNSDDYDARILTTGSGLNITTNTGVGSVRLQHETATKLATTSTGIDVTGSVSASSTFKLSQTGGNILEVGVGADKTVISNGWSSGVGDWLKLEVPSGDDEPGMIQINSNGNVGIGTSSPSAKLHLHSTTNPTIHLTDDTLNSGYGGAIRGYGVTNSGGHLQLGVLDVGTFRRGIEMSAQLGQISFYTSPTQTERMRITSAGNVGIGTSSPSTALEVNGIASIDAIQSTAASTNITIKPGATGSQRGYVEIYPDDGNWYDQGGGIIFKGGQDSGASGTAYHPDAKIYLGDTSAGSASDGEDLVLVTGGTGTGSGSITLRTNGEDVSINNGNITTTGSISSSGIGITGEATASVRYLTATGNSNSGYQFTGDGDTGMHSSANNILQFSTGGSERLRITSAGNVGIGTTAPAEKLDVAGSIKASGTFKGSVAAPALFTYRHVGSLSPTPTVFTTRTALQSAGLVSGGIYVFTAVMDSYHTGITAYSLLGVTKPWIFSTDSSNHSSTYTIGDFVWQGHAYHPTVTIHYRFELGTSGANQDFLVSSTGTSTTDFAAGVAGKKLDIYIKRIA